MIFNWKLIRAFYLFCGITGIIANSMILPITFVTSKSAFGSYRFLIACFIAASLFSSIENTIIMPMFTVDARFWSIYSVGFSLGATQEVGSYLVVLFCMNVIILLLSLTYSYINRAALVCSPEFLQWFEKPFKRVFLVIAFIFISGCFGSLSLCFLLPTSHTNLMFGEYFNQTYDLDIRSLSYIIAETYIDDQPTFTFLFVFIVRAVILWTCFLVMIASAIIFYKKAFEMARTLDVSSKTYHIQMQLFRVLLFQTTIPTIFTYSPIMITFIMAFLRMDHPHVCEVISLMLPIAQVVDPLLIVLMLADYRRTLQNLPVTITTKLLSLSALLGRQSTSSKS